MGGRELVGISLIVLGSLAPTLGHAQAEENVEPEETAPGGAAEEREGSTEAPTPAEDRRAHELYELGDRLYSHGQYDAAIDSFREAYRLSRRPLMLFNLANAQERAGYLPGAVESLERYLPSVPEAERGAVENRIASLGERIASTSELPSTPEPELPSTPKPELPSTPEPALPSTPDPAPDLIGPAAVLTTGGLFLAAGLVLGIASLDVRSQIDSMCATLDDGRRLCPLAAEGLIEENLTLSAIADVSLVFGAVGVVLGVYLLVDAISGQDASVVVRAAIGPGSIALLGRFP